MTLAPGDYVVWVKTRSGDLVALPAISPNTAGKKCLFIKDVTGKTCAIKLSAISPGGKVLFFPDKSGHNIAVKCGGIVPNPPPAVGWAQIFAESPGWYTYKAKAWGNYIYVTMTDFGIGVIWRYSDALGWESVLDPSYYGVAIIYDL